MVQLPGVQDTAKAKDILGRTATLEIRMVDELARPDGCGAAGPGSVRQRARAPSARAAVSLVKKDVVLTGDSITDASPGFDSTKRPARRAYQPGRQAARASSSDVTRENVGKRMAILLIEKGKGRSHHRAGDPRGNRRRPGADHRHDHAQEATDVALLLRAGALAAPMQIIEERTVGPSMGAENIDKGFHSNIWGFVAIALFMIIYYRFFGLFSTAALAVNVLLPGGAAVDAAGHPDPARHGGVSRSRWAWRSTPTC